MEEENSFEEKITAARARRQPLVVRHIDTEEEDEDNEQCSLTSSPERVPELQDTAYSFLNGIQHTQQITEFGQEHQEQQSIQHEDEIELNHEQQKDTIRIDVDHEQQNGLASAPLNKEVDNLGTVPPQLNDPKQLQALVEEIGIVMNGAQQQQQQQQQQSYDNSTTDRVCLLCNE